jgi:hypothetical protein
MTASWCPASFCSRVVLLAVVVLSLSFALNRGDLQKKYKPARPQSCVMWLVVVGAQACSLADSCSCVSSFDYIIVGGGPAGIVMARKLTDDSRKKVGYQGIARL